MSLTLSARHGRHVDRDGGSESRITLKLMSIAVALTLVVLAAGSTVVLAGLPLLVVAVITMTLLGVIALAVIIATPNKFAIAVRGAPLRLKGYFYHHRYGRHVDRRELMKKYLEAIGIGHHATGIGPVVRQ